MLSPVRKATRQNAGPLNAYSNGRLLSIRRSLILSLKSLGKEFYESGVVSILLKRDLQPVGKSYLKDAG